jgi:indole-3-glycerol phosphate synthase/phosphoribosylanthranilate isomerase
MMSSVLDKIVENKKLEVAAGKYHQETNDLPSSTRSLYESLLTRKPGFIFECKAASPSKGLIATNYQPAKLAQQYQPFAAAISVLTDEKYFQGSLSHLKAVSETTNLPVLCKDFFISKQQVLSARANGADAILLMLSVLDDEQYQSLATQAQLLSLDVLTEVHDTTELERAIALGAKIIGVNNRNLGTLEINMNTTAELSKNIPVDCVLVSESGYTDRNQLLKAFENDREPNGFLVGSHLSAAEDTGLAIREFIFGRVKICGLTSVEDAQVASEQGAYYGGLIFSENSPRFISDLDAQQLTGAVPLKWVGVFTQTSNEFILEKVKNLKLAAVQIHFDCDYKQLLELKLSLPQGCEIWLLVRVDKSTISLTEIMSLNKVADRILIEPSGQLAGGNGISFDWGLLANKSLDLKKTILAGGLEPLNINQARKTGAAILDVNSGVENLPGQKSFTKISKLFKQLLPGQQ